MFRCFSIIAALAVASPALGADEADSSEPTLDVQLLYPTPSAMGFFNANTGRVNPHMAFFAGAFFNYTRKPLSISIRRDDGTEDPAGAVVDNRFDLNLMGSIGLWDAIEVGLVLPMIAQGGFEGDKLAAANIEVGVDSLKGFTPGDARISTRWMAYNLEEGLFAVAPSVTVVAPSAGGTAYAGENSLVYIPEVAVSTEFGPMRFAANLGHRFRDRTEVQTLVVDDEYFWKFAGSFKFESGGGSPVELIAEVFGHTPSGNVFGSKATDPVREAFQRARTALELDVGARMTVLDGVNVSIGGGTGLRPGVGAPLPRLFAAVSFDTANRVPLDSDGDLLPDDVDKCPDRPEDIDQFKDDDGCPEFDNDEDSVLDEDDQCPNDPEDRDGFKDEDGCPDPDNDEDGILDADDKCAEPEDKDGFEDEDGCPDFDNDADGIADGADQCPDQAEDVDGFKDSDGCPEVDNDGDGLDDLGDLCPNHAEDFDEVVDDDGCPEENDGDGIPDHLDKCPNEAETYNGVEDGDGCPEKLKTKSLVKVTEDKIEIKDKVYFKSGKSKILSKSFNLLDQVAAVLKNYRHIRKLRIEGHTDSKGRAAKNRRLSRKRASAVRKYLIQKGVEPERLIAEGFGSDRPVASNASKRGREQNRRVEFFILELAPIGVDVAEEARKAEEAKKAAEAEAEIEIEIGVEEPSVEVEIDIETPSEDDELLDLDSADTEEEDDGGVEIELEF